MSGEKGTSLIEALVAMAMLGFAMTYSLTSTDKIVSSSHTSRDMARANNIAVEVMEELMSVYDSDVKLTNGSHSQTFDREGNRSNAPVYFTATWIVRTDTPITKVSEIVLSVGWLENGNQKFVHLQTFRGT